MFFRRKKKEKKSAIQEFLDGFYTGQAELVRQVMADTFLTDEARMRQLNKMFADGELYLLGHPFAENKQ